MIPQHSYHDCPGMPVSLFPPQQAHDVPLISPTPTLKEKDEREEGRHFFFIPLPLFTYFPSNFFLNPSLKPNRILFDLGSKTSTHIELSNSYHTSFDGLCW